MRDPSSAVARLRGSADVRAVLRRGRRHAGSFMAVHCLATGAGEPRAAVVASRKVGNAVQRNRAKRVLREAVRATGLSPGHDYVLVARPRCADAPFQAVHDELSWLVRRHDQHRIE